MKVAVLRRRLLWLLRFRHRPTPRYGPGPTIREDLVRFECEDGLPLRLVDVDDRILTLHGPVARGMSRFKRYVAAALIVLALGNGWAVRMHQEFSTDRREAIVAAAASSDRQAWKACQQRNASTAQSRRLLVDLAKVSDPAEREVWRRWVKKVPAVVDCGPEPPATGTVKP